MNHRFTTEEKTFANEHVAGGREILEKEQDLGRKTTCVNVATTVLVSEAGATSLSVLILISLMFLAGGKGENGVLMLTQVVTAFVAHGIGLVAVWKSMRGILLFAVTLNLLEVILNVTRLCLILNSESGIEKQSIGIIWLLTEVLCDLMMMAFKVMLFLELRKNR